ncbi:MAG: hypothetical protein ACKVQR_18625 [Aquabacterium sp.]
MAEKHPMGSPPQPGPPGPASSPTARAGPRGTAPRVMLLSVWTGDDAAWRARLVLPDARAHEFASPFELARFLAQPPMPPAAPGAASPGLR